MPKGDNPNSRANLKKTLTAEEARELGKNGAKKSIVARRRKKAMREIALAILDGKLTSQDREALKQFGGTLKAIGGDTKKGLAYWRCLQKATLAGSSSDLAKLLEIAGEFTPSPDVVIPPTERTVVQIIAPKGTKVGKNAKSKKN